MKRLTATEFWGMFDKSVHVYIAQTCDVFHDAESLVIFENQDMWSSRMGQRTAVICGPSNTYKSHRDTEGKWLNDLPSQRQYATYWIPVQEIHHAIT
jgi:hypothetical protein